MNIIEQIVQIDSIAQKELDEAYKIDNDIKERTKKLMDADKATVDSEVYEELKLVDANEKASSDLINARVKASTEENIKRLNDIYNKNHQALEDDVFNSIIK